MKSAQKPQNEDSRLKSLEALDILDSLPEKDFDQLTRLASQICETPIALISLVDKDRQWFKSKVGLNAAETPRELAFCAHAILQDEVFVIEDSSKDERFADNPLVTGNPQVQFYAGAQLKSPDGANLGTVCVIDSKPRKLSHAQIDSLKAISEQVTRLLELKLQIKKLKTSEEHLVFKSIAVENIEEGVVLQDATNAIIDFNPAALTALNLSADQLLGKNSMDPHWCSIREDGTPLPGHEHPAVTCLITGQKQLNFIMGIYSSSTDLRWLRINAIPIFLNGSPKPTHTVTSFANVTSQFTNQKLVENNQKTLRFLLDSIPHLIGQWNSDLINIESNIIYKKYYGLDPDSIRGKHLKDVIGTEVFSANLSYIVEALNGKTVKFEAQLPYHDGSKKNVIGTLVPSFLNEKVTGFLSIIIDITELKSLENERRTLELKLAESARLSALGEMAGGVAHEINNPLAIIRARTGLLKKKVRDNKFEIEAAVKELETIEITVDRIAKIIRGLKSYSRNAEADPFSSANVLSMVDDTLELCREKFKFSSIDLRMQCDQTLSIQCRSAQISQILMNLLSNSFDAIIDLSERWIDVKVVDSASTIEIVVQDSGGGISDAILKKIMQPFFTTKDIGKGTGLGLSISTGIAESHGGTLKYDSTQSNTTFVLTLPKVQINLKTQVA